jgi:hypothetical protein
VIFLLSTNFIENSMAEVIFGTGSIFMTFR